MVFFCQVYDGSSSEAPLLGKFCGSKIPHPLVASTNNMMILFKSDASVHRRGFHGKYTTGDLIHFYKLMGK